MAMQLPCDAGKQQNTRSKLIVLMLIIICCYRLRVGTVLYFRIKGWSVSSEDPLDHMEVGPTLEPLISLILFHQVTLLRQMLVERQRGKIRC